MHLTSKNGTESTEMGSTHSKPKELQLDEIWYLGFHLGHGQMHPQTDNSKTQERKLDEAVSRIFWLLLLRFIIIVKVIIVNRALLYRHHQF